MPVHHPGPLHCQDCASKDESIFCELQGLDLVDMSNHKVVNTYKKGQTLFVQGNPPFGLFCISSGNIKLSKIGPTGKESIVKIASKGEIIGHRSLFTGCQLSATATALEDTVVCFIDKKYIIKLVQDNPMVASKVIQQMAKSLGAAQDRVASLAQKSVRERLAELLLLLKQSHGIDLGKGRTKLDIKMTREEMASLIGTAPETLIRLISELREEGILDQEGKVIFICQEDQLMEQAGLGF